MASILLCTNPSHLGGIDQAGQLHSIVDGKTSSPGVVVHDRSGSHVHAGTQGPVRASPLLRCHRVFTPAVVQAQMRRCHALRTPTQRHAQRPCPSHAPYGAQHAQLSALLGVHAAKPHLRALQCAYPCECGQVYTKAGYVRPQHAWL